MSTERTAARQGADDALLAGACELAMLEDAWEHFVKRPAFSYLFVIDAPRITSIHALPPQNIAQFGITGLLSSPDRPVDLFGRSFEEKQKHYHQQARQYPLTVGMTEILARYVFTDRWSAGNPKLIMPSQWQSISRILEAVETTSIEELRRTLDAAVRHGALDRLREHMAASSSPERLLDEVLDRLPELMPAVYGAYTATRQLFRYMEVLPLDARANGSAVFADSYADIHEILERAQAVDPGDDMSLVALETRWRQCIPARQDRALLATRFPNLVRPGSSMHLENARTFAEIEYVNRRFKADGLPHRLAFVTTTGRLFTAALKRFAREGAGQEYVQLRHETEGTRDSYRKFRYYARLLEQGDDDDIGLLPLVDPRMLMTSPDFVGFANSESGAASSDSSRAISAWILLFFEFLRSDSGAGLDIQRLFELYRRLVLKAPDPQRGETAEFAALAQEVDPAALKRNWSDYVSLVSAAETSGRLVKADAELRAALLAGNSGPDQLREVVNRRLNETMSQWLSSLSDSALRKRVDRSAEQRASVHFERMPALLLPILRGCSLSQDELAKLFEDVSRPAGPQEALAEWIASGTARVDADARYGVKARYVQILGQAYLFGMLGHWDSVQLLTMQAFALAENFLAEEDPGHEETYVSGREAAYLAAVSRRRQALGAAAPETQEDEALHWLDKYREALALETEKHGLSPVQVQLLQQRVNAEELAWQLQSWLHFLHRRDTVPASARSFYGAGPDVIAPRAETILSTCDRLLPELEQSPLLPGLRDAYLSVARALCRDLAVIALQIQVLAPKVSRTSRDRLRRHLRVLEAEQGASPGLERIAGLEREVIRTARRTLGEAATDIPGIAEEDAQRLDTFDRWRLDLLRSSARGSLPY